MGRTWRPYNPAAHRRRKLMQYQREHYGIEPFTDAGPTQDHIEYLRTRITIYEIARRSGVSPGTIQAHAASDGTRRDKIRPGNAKAILAVRFRADDLTQDERLRGALRILRGLYARGFTSRVVAETTGVISVNKHPNSLVNMKDDGSRYNPSATIYTALMHAAEKLEAADPRDYGISERGMHCNISRAKTAGWPPLGAWDMDTIHEADAMPDWTGACGTMQGWQIHYRHKIPMCEPCREAKARNKRESK